MTAKTLKNLAVALLALAIACVALAFSASNQRLAIQGPSALAVLPDRSVWLSVDQALWHLDADGARVAVVDGRTLAVGGLIGNLVLHPDGRLVASVRDDPTLYFLDPSSARIVHRLAPQWPTDLARHASRAITFAFHDDGRVAIATGGGHAVAVFDANGRFLGRSRPGLYQFTNGLWWTAGSLWTTDTNGVALVELDAATWREKARVPLVQQEGPWRYLGMAVASEGKAAPLATVVRFRNGMIEGRAVDVFGNGTQKAFPAQATLEPRDIKWRTGELLLVDGASYSVKRYSDQRAALPDFGDAQVRRELTGLLALRDRLQVQYYAGLVAAVLLFALGFAAALRSQALEKQQALAAAGADLSQLGTPRLSGWALAVMAFQHFWLSLLVFAATALLQYVPRLPGLGKTVVWAVLLALLLVSLAAMFLLLRALRRAASDPQAEALFNYTAVRALETDVGFWSMRKPGEVPRETLMLTSGAGTQRWLVLTNQRLLVFVTNFRDRTLAAEYPRRTIAGLNLLEPSDMRWWQRMQRAGGMGAVLRFKFKDGEVLEGTTPARQTAQRMAELLRATAFDAPTISQMGRALREQSEARKASAQGQPALLQVLGSLLVPGLGQWMQRRNGTALRMFLAWVLVLLVSAVPVVWTLWAPRAAVSPTYVLSVAASYLIICALAAADTWRMRKR
jgi:hypothetical protein